MAKAIHGIPAFNKSELLDFLSLYDRSECEMSTVLHQSSHSRVASSMSELCFHVDGNGNTWYSGIQ